MNDTNLIWLDLEMTGLDPLTDHIIEIALVATDKNLKILDQTESIAIYQPHEVLAQMNEWCVEQHGTSGLTERVKQSNISLKEAEEISLKFMKQWVPECTSPMCGNTICQDRRFLAQYMPSLEAYFHYRHIDVSTFKELAMRWSPDVLAPKHESAHLALNDVMDSINELRHYRTHFIQE